MSRVQNIMATLDKQHKEYTHKMANIEYKRGSKFDKITTHDLDKILHKKIKAATKMRIPTKQEFY